ncbi:hypothetical protein HC891_25510 [Candidatus Gracilibacteria bacterium]|nr:hypothetical protein [Candidatus Gracilibacteria bacterium]
MRSPPISSTTLGNSPVRPISKITKKPMTMPGKLSGMVSAIASTRLTWPGRRSM